MTMEPHDELARENARLRQRIAELEHETTSLRAEVEALTDEHARTEQAMQLLNEELQRNTEELRIFKMLVENAPDAIGVTDLNGHFTYINAAFREQHRINGPPDAITTPELIAPQERERVATTLMPQLLREGSWVGTLMRRRMDGEVFPVHLAGFVMRDEQGQMVALASISRDISEERAQQQRIAEHTAALNQYQAVLQGFLDHLPAAMFVRDTAGRFLIINHYYAELLHMPAEQIVGKSPYDVMAAEDAHLFLANDRAVLESGSPITREEVASFITFLAIKFPIYDAEGTMTAIGGISTDITAQKQMEQELRIFKMIADNAPDAIGFAAPTGVITYANAAFGAMTDYGDALPGMHVLDLLAEVDEAALAEETAQMLRDGVWKGTVTFLRKDGSTVQGDSSHFMLRDANGEPLAVVAIIRDLTEQRKAEAEHARLQQQLIEAQQVAIRELSTPLLPLADHVIAMPLVGTIDCSRAQQVMETLLEGIADYQAETAIVDITGITTIDTQIAQALIRTAQAVRLLGAHIILTGIQPPIAQALVHLGADLSGILTYSTLQAGIDYALHRQENSKVSMQRKQAVQMREKPLR